jgi:Rrf2 family protein
MLTMKTKYALKALIVMAAPQRGQMHARDIAARANVPYKFLEAILCELKTRGIVNSRRGMAGGFSLARDSRQIMVADIIRLMDGPLAPIRCASMTAYRACDDCPDENLCALHDVMGAVRQAMSEILDKRSIYDLMQFENKSEKDVA